MNTKDLMIGDWVYSSQKNINHYTQITEIDNDGLFVSDESGIINGKKFFRMHFMNEYLNEIQPIPLTAEILEKNGIMYQSGYPWYQGIYDEEGIEVHFAEYCQMHLKYVHELQHALRLLNFNIEIKL